MSEREYQDIVALLVQVRTELATTAERIAQHAAKDKADTERIEAKIDGLIRTVHGNGDRSASVLSRLDRAERWIDGRAGLERRAAAIAAKVIAIALGGLLLGALTAVFTL